MADFNGAKPVMTVRDDEFKIKLVDGQSGDTATKVLSVVGETDSFSAGVNDLGIPCMVKTSAGAAKILQLVAGDRVPVAVVDADGHALDLNADGSVNVAATNLDIRDLTHASDSVKVGDGTDFLAVNIDGSINVKVAPAGAKICDYKTTATVGVGTEVLHFYVVSNALTFQGLKAIVGARGAVKVRVGTSSDGLALDGVKFVYFQDPKENIDHDISNLSLLGDGTKAIAIGITNLDGSSSDVYSTLQGFEA